ncbi:MAG: hypothetical protein HDQ99_04280 [Lachnospiraceae bacterium]|uniref:hypothetical protein n=1 Tax=Enterocloster clostridioformis TaxID=1531 RepID=UPI0003FBBD55|nr:hypothetical protein [Enterocloster clostridioformis]MBD5534866.1 hypothetical protein [Lachnospiraceae bacterium]
MDYEELYKNLSKRYYGMTPDSLQSILCPLLVPIKSIDPTVFKVPGQQHWRASFDIELNDDYYELMVVGRTGKFVSKEYALGTGVWTEIAKGRIIDVDYTAGIAHGEIYTGNSSKVDLVDALSKLQSDNYLEIDQYGASAKILSALEEHNLAEMAKAAGYKVRRMPEDCAKHLRTYYNYDFEFEKAGISKKIEVKSIWGTDTRFARLIHSKNNGYKTSSCKFETQDIFAVSLFLRTGNPMDFAFAKSISEFDDPIHGLPHATGFPEYVTQNPLCEIDNIKWFDSIDGVWEV